MDLKALAKRGAEVRIVELQAEMNALYKAFPDLRRGTIAKANASEGGLVGNGRRRKRTPMTAAQRKAVGMRMKKYWAAKRKTTAATK